MKTVYGARGDGSSDDTAALQRALNEVGNSGKSDVVYFPAGTYRITSTLNLQYRSNIGIIGQDPSNTTIIWGGPSGGTMMVVNGVTQSRWGRITWDGKGSAGAGVAHQWDQRGGFAPTNMEHADEVFRDMGKGIIGGRWGGANDAEITIVRDKFTNCSQAGVSIESFNALDYWIWDSQFINNARGVTNEFGAGNFMVYRSFFQNSSVADLNMGNTQFFSFRGNTSIGSRQFLRATNAGQNSARVTIQGNKILDTLDPVAIDVGNVGPLFLIDNKIRSGNGVSGPAVRLSTGSTGGDLISIGNTYTVSNPISVQTPSARWWAQDDQVVTYSQIDGSLPTMPGTLLNLNRRVFEVAAGANAGTIQQAINQAAQYPGQRPVVHLPKGNYPVGQTITVPANSDVQIVGDGHGTNLSWSASGGGNMFQLTGPSKATFREVMMYANNANGIEIGNPDQPGSRLHVDGMLQEHARQNNILTEGLQYTTVNLQSHQMTHEGGSSIKVIGAGGAGTSRVAIFAGATGADAYGSMPMYEVTNGGRILVEDTWYEGPASRLVYLTDSGTFTYNGGHIAPQSCPLDPVIEAANFKGLATFLGVSFDLDNIAKRIQITSENAGTQTLFAGLEGNISNYFARLSSGGYLNFINSKLYGSSGSMPTPDQGDPRTAQFIRTMLVQLRTTLPSMPTNLAAGVTDVRLYRVDIAYPNVGIHLKSSGQTPPPVNYAPMVSAGSNQSITLPATATLNGSASDDGLPNNTLITTWSRVSGPGTVTFANPASLNTTVSFPGSGTYVLQLTASDSALSSSATVTITVSAGSTSPLPPPPGQLPTLVAAYSFNEGSGTTPGDASGNGNVGTIANATWTSAGKYGSALVFNGTNSLVTIKDSVSLHLTTGMTLEAWVKPTVVNGTWRDVVYKGNDNYSLEATSNQKVVPAGVATAGGVDVVEYGTTPLVANTWSHLALTYDGTTLRFYVNGAQASSLTRTGSLLTSSNPLQIGGDSIYGQYFQGAIDEVRVYNGPLTAAQIQADMNAPIGSTDTKSPTAPANLAATVVSGTQINLTWTASTDNVGVTGYQVERCQGAGCTSFAQIGTLTGTSYNNTGLNSGVGYSYRVRATDAAANRSGYSNTVTAQISDTQPPTAPANLAATVVSGTQINLTWTASTDNVGVTGYQVERCQGAGCTSFAQIGTLAGTSYNNTGLNSGVGYSYRVRATDAAANRSGYSKTISATTSNQIPSATLMAAYAFNEGTGSTVQDLSGNNNTGTISNATWTTAGKYGSALKFNGTNGMVTIKDAASLHLTTAMTLEAWVRPSVVVPSWQDLIYKGNDNYYLEVMSPHNSAPGAGATFSGADDAAMFGTNPLVANAWTHLALTFDGKAIRLFVNGVQASSLAHTGSFVTSSNPLQIGGDSVYGQYFNGIIDEVRVYNIALNATQIQSDMNTPLIK